MSGIVNMLSQAERSRVKGGVLCLSLAFVLLLLFSQFTTPLNPYHGGDQSIFLVIGRGITDGLVPYRDLYDHKGVVLFLIEAAGWWLCPGKTGIFIIQTLFFAVDIACVWKICRLFSSEIRSAAGTLLFCALFTGTIGGGNTCEEYALTLNLVPFYLYLRALCGPAQDRKGLTSALALLSGVCMGLVFFIRMNDAALVLAILPVLVLLLWRERRFKLLLLQALCWAAGFALCVAAVVSCFVCLGALDELLEGTFLHNVRYALAGMTVRPLELKLALLARLLYVPVSGIMLLCLWRSRKLPGWPALLLFVGGLTVGVSRWPGEGYMHYFTAVTPCVAITFVLATMVCKRLWQRGLFLTLLFAPYAMSCAVAVAAFNRYTFTDKDKPALMDAQALARLIPAGEQDSVWFYDTPPNVYTMSGLKSCCPFFTMQAQHRACVPRMEPTIDKMLADGRPLWLIVGKGCKQTPLVSLNQALEGDYELVVTLEGLHVDVYRRQPAK